MAHWSVLLGFSLWHGAGPIDRDNALTAHLRAGCSSWASPLCGIAVGVAYKVCRFTASQGVKVLLVYSVVTGPLLVLLALHTYIPALDLTIGKIWAGYGIAFAVAARDSGHGLSDAAIP